MMQRRPGAGRGGDPAAQPLAVAVAGQQAAQGRHLQPQEAAREISPASPACVTAEARGSR